MPVQVVPYPVLDRVFILQDAAKSVTEGGIILPESAQVRDCIGTVAFVGPGRYHEGKLIAPSVSVGDRVIFNKYSCSEVTIDGVAYLMTTEEGIYSVLRAFEYV